MSNHTFLRLERPSDTKSGYSDLREVVPGSFLSTDGTMHASGLQSESVRGFPSMSNWTIWFRRASWA